jgi:hypothetical protein
MSTKQENTVIQWAFKNNSILITAENWHLKGHTLYIKVHAVPLQHYNFYYKYENTIRY